MCIIHIDSSFLHLSTRILENFFEKTRGIFIFLNFFPRENLKFFRNNFEILVENFSLKKVVTESGHYTHRKRP